MIPPRVVKSTSAIDASSTTSERGDGRRVAGSAAPVGGSPGPIARRAIREEILAVEELHREEPAAGVLEELVVRDEVRVRDVGERAELALEAEDAGAVEPRQRLQRDLDAALRVERAVHDAHAALAELAEDAEARRADERFLDHRLGV